MESFEDMLIRHEGIRAEPYIDSRGVQTIGIGHNLHKPLSHAAIMQIFRDDLADARNDCLHAFPWFADLDESRQWVILNMCFNLGLPKLLGFKKFLVACERGDYQTAHDEMLDSDWASQVGKKFKNGKPQRALELASLMRGSVGI